MCFSTSNMIKLYYDDPYIKEFISVVIASFKEKNGYNIVLDKTAFYPEGGGQPCDKGKILYDDKIVPVISVKEVAGTVLHFCTTDIPVGTEITGIIDFERRFDFMQQHTGEHILSGIAQKMFGYENVGFHLTDDNLSVDFSGVLEQSDITKLFAAANMEILKASTIACAFYSNVDGMDFRCKKELSGEIRIVAVGDVDRCACCGTHTKSTAEVMVILPTQFSKYKGGTRIYFNCGIRAIADYTAKNNICNDISTTLSVKPLDTYGAVKSRLIEIEELKSELYQKKQELFEMWVKNISSGPIGFFTQEGLSSQDLQTIASLLSQKCTVGCATSLQSDNTTKIAIVSAFADTNALGKIITAELGGKGGGKNGSFQGFCTKEGNIITLLANPPLKA